MEKETKMYEAGYLIAPLVPEEKLDDEISAVRKAIESGKCLITGEERARTRKLAYPLKKPPLGVFESAYFGWIKFIAEPESVKAVDAALKGIPSVLRFILVESAPEAVSRKPRARAAAKAPAGGGEKGGEGVKQEEIDKKLEEMLA